MQSVTTYFYIELTLTLPQEMFPYLCWPKSVVFDTKRY